MATACGVAAVLYRDIGSGGRSWIAGAGVALLLGALVAPRALRPANRAWAALGRAMHAVTSPAVLAVILYGVITPIGLVVRWSGKDPLRLRWNSGESTYWIRRSSSEPRPSMRNQF
jgi:hypothetical protein